jgi:NAD+ diphosphatase
MEEAGISVKNVKYHSSQPWPLPYSLMIGCHAEAASTNINMDPEEMTAVKWFTREEVLESLEKSSEILKVPIKIAIAHHLLKDWAYKNI